MASKTQALDAEAVRTQILAMLADAPGGLSIRQFAEAILPEAKTDVQDRNNQARIQYQTRTLEKAKRLSRKGQLWFLSKSRPEPEIDDLPAKRTYTRRSPASNNGSAPQGLRAYIIADIRAKLLELEKLG